MHADYELVRRGMSWESAQRLGKLAAAAEQAGFDFHSIDGERYWDERGYYAFTLDEIEDEIEGPVDALERGYGLSNVELHDIGQAEGAEVLASPAGQIRVPYDMVHRPAAVLLYCAGEPRRRITEPGAQLEHPPCSAEPREQVAELAGGGPDDGEIGAPGLHLEFGQACGPRRYQFIQVRRKPRGEQLHHPSRVSRR